MLFYAQQHQNRSKFNYFLKISKTELGWIDSMTFQSCCLPDAGYDDGGGHVCWDDEGYYTWKSCCEQPLQGWRAEVQRNFKQITVEELFQAELERLGEKYRTYYQRRISFHRLMHCVEQFELDGNFKALSGLHHRDFGKPDICRRKI